MEAMETDTNNGSGVAGFAPGGGGGGAKRTSGTVNGQMVGAGQVKHHLHN